LLPFTELRIIPATPATHTTAAPPLNQLIGTRPCCQSSSHSGQPSVRDRGGYARASARSEPWRGKRQRRATVRAMPKRSGGSALTLTAVCT
jgi:hypothetical protein